MKTVTSCLATILLVLLLCLLQPTHQASAQYSPAGAAVAGRAVFSASGGTISNLSVSGIIGGVSRIGVGHYTVSFTASQTNYAVAISATDNNSASVTAYLSGNSFSTIQTSASSFDIYCTYGSAGNVGDPAVVTVSVF